MSSSESAVQAPPRPSRPRLIPALEFDPSPELSEKLVSLMADPDFTIGAVASVASTSIESLTLWLTRPDIAARLDAMESVISRKARLDVASYTGAITHACSTTIRYYAEAMNHRHVPDNDHRGQTILVKEASNALLASRILLHLGKYHSTRPAHPRTAPAAPQNPAPTNTPDESNPTTEHPKRFELLPRLNDITFNLHDQRAANHTTPANPTRDNAHEPASTSPSHERRSAESHARDEALLVGRIPGSAAQGVNDSTATPAIALPLPTSDLPLPPSLSQPASPDSPSCAGHSKSKRKPCNGCASPTPTTLLISAGTTTKRTQRTREPTKPTR